jgi:hypothetical protein
MEIRADWAVGASIKKGEKLSFGERRTPFVLIYSTHAICSILKSTLQIQ